MKILYVAKRHNYGKLGVENDFSYAYQNFYQALTRMDDGKNEIINFPLDEKLAEEGKKINEDLLETVEREKPDLVFFVINLIDSTALKKETIKEISKKTTTLNWFTDDHWQFDKFSKHWASCFIWVATTDSRAPEKYRKIGYQNAIRTQWACNQYVYQPQALPKIYDVSFVGYAHSNRKKIMKELEKAGITVECWGKGWPKGAISYQEMLRILSQSKINLNFSWSSIDLRKEIASIFFNKRYDGSVGLVNPKYWIDNLKSVLNVFKKKQIKGRIFEILGCRGFLLTDYADDCENYYREGKEIVYYKNLPDLIEKIKYYLQADKEREEIARAGYQRTMREHTFENRFKEIFKIIGLKN
jgi:spore maturation protein CgeB